MSRRAVGRLVLLLVGVFAAAAIAAVLVSRQADDGPHPPPVELGLLPWLPRGELKGDDVLAAQAADAWRLGSLVDGGSAPVPVDDVYVLWAGTIGAGRVVLLEGVAADSTPLVAQVAEHDDPAVLGLDGVQAIPAGGDVPALGVTYDGNLDIPGLAAGQGADLIQVLLAPTSDTGDQAVWQQVSEASGNDLELLDEFDEGMTETFLYLGFEGDPPTRLVVGEVGARAGIAATIEVLPRQLIPSRPAIEVVDGPPWGPSGRIDGGEDLDARLAATRVNVPRAAVREVVAGAGDVGGVAYSARLLEVQRDESSAFVVLVVRDAEGEVACMSWQPPLDEGPLDPMPAGGRSIVVERCIEYERDLLVTAVAAPPGSGPIRLSGGTTAPLEDVERFVAVEAYSAAARTPLVASLADDPDETVTLRPLAPVRSGG